MNILKSKNKLLALLLVLSLSITVLAGCSDDSNDDMGDADNTKLSLSSPIKVATLNGPTGMGMVKLMEDAQTEADTTGNPLKYQITTYQSPDEIVGKIVSGEVDLAAVPSNLASVLYNKTQGQIEFISPLTLGVLYIMENTENGTATVTSIEELKGKTIYASGKGGSPEYILNKLLADAGLDPARDVTISWLTNHADVVSSMINTAGSISMLPEPFVTVAQSKSPSVKMAVDLNFEWENATGEPLIMGTLIAQKSFTESREKDLDIFMKDYTESVAFVNNNPKDASSLISKYGFIADKAVAEKAIPYCNIVLYSDDNDMAEFSDDKGELMLSSFLKILFDMDPKSVGGTLPDEEFYD